MPEFMCMKKIFLLGLFLLSCSMGILATERDKFNVNGITFRQNNSSEAELVNADCDKYSTIPQDVMRYGVRYAVAVIGEAAFKGCDALVDVELPVKVRQINRDAFKNCKKLKHIAFSKNLNKIGEGAFRGSGLLMVDMPRGVQELKDETFKDCKKMESITLPSSLEKIGHKAFCGCISLKHIELPKLVEKLGTDVFAGCINLKEIRIKALNPPVVDGNPMGSVKAKIIVPSVSLEKYKKHVYWGQFEMEGE